MKKLSRLEKIAKKLKLNVRQLTNIIVYNHELENFIPKKQLKKVDLDIDLESRKLIDNLAKTLKVSPDAVIGSLLINYIKEKEEQKRDKAYAKAYADAYKGYADAYKEHAKKLKGGKNAKSNS